MVLSCAAAGTWFYHVQLPVHGFKKFCTVQLPVHGFIIPEIAIIFTKTLV